MAFSYFYELIGFNDKLIGRRPTVPIIINGYNFTGLLDSGSDSIVIPKEIAEALQLKEDDETELCQMDGSSKKCKISQIEIQFGKGHEQYSFKSKVLISEAARIILGRKGFFDHFKITFDETNEIVHFKENSNSKILFK